MTANEVSGTVTVLEAGAPESVAANELLDELGVQCPLDERAAPALCSDVS